MKKYLYSIKDIKAKTFDDIIPQVNDDVFLRVVKTFKSNHKEHEWNIAPEDFEIWKLAEVDYSTGLVTPQLEFIKTMGEI